MATAGPGGCHLLIADNGCLSGVSSHLPGPPAMGPEQSVILTSQVQKYQTILQKMYGTSGGKFVKLTADKPDVL